MPYRTLKTQSNLYSILKRHALALVLIIGLVLFVFDLIYAITDTHYRIIEETEIYREQVKMRLVSDVDIAYTIIETVRREHADDTPENARRHIVSNLESITLANLSYYFSADYDGHTVIGPAKGQNVYDIEDMNGLKVVQTLIATAKAGGGFVEYVMPPIDGVAQKPKISYVRPVEAFNWYIGAGVDYDVINAVESRIKSEKIKQFLLRMLLLIAVIVLIITRAYAFNKRLYKKIFEHVNRLVDYIQHASTHYVEIPIESFTVDEFKTIAEKTQALIDKREEHTYLLEKQAYFDAITTLPNRNYLIKELQRHLTENQTQNSCCGAIALIDLDHFKVTNDTFGHVFGDKVLMTIAKLLQENVKDGLVARFSGDEYWVLLPDLENPQALDQKLLAIKNLFKQSFQIEGRQLQFSISIGVAIYPDHGTEVEDLLRKADLAMYAAKDEGKNRYAFFDKSMLEGNYNFFFYESEMRQALLNNEFFLHYQPQFDTKTRRIQGFESLIRWQTSDGRLIMPGDFIPIAEKTGTISQITLLVIDLVCQFSAKINKGRAQPLPISINVSVQDLSSPIFVERLNYMAQKHHISPSDLILEITESGLLENFNLATSQMGLLKAQGYRFALDDFGTGYSSLRYVMELAIDIIKIDKSFIDNLATNAKSQKMVMVIEDIAQTLGLMTVAEGVETEEQAEALKQIGISALQGYLLSRPISEAHVVELLKTHQ